MLNRDKHQLIESKLDILIKNEVDDANIENDKLSLLNNSLISKKSQILDA
jgi:hypothetical protein